MFIEQIKLLRERTGAGWLDCKKALMISGGDVELAVKKLRELGSIKATNKAGRLAVEGVIELAVCGKQAAMVEVNCETDFVARNQEFLTFVQQLAQTILAQRLSTVDQLLTIMLHNTMQTVEEARQELVAKTGENIVIRRLLFAHHPHAMFLGTYVHRQRIGAIVELTLSDKELARQVSSYDPANVAVDAADPAQAALIATYHELAHDIAMHIAAHHPRVILPEDMPRAILDREMQAYVEQAEGSGKPKEVVDKMAQGRLSKFLEEASLVSQPFVKQTDITIGSLLHQQRARVLTFARFAIGEEDIIVPDRIVEGETGRDE